MDLIDIWDSATINQDLIHNQASFFCTYFEEINVIVGITQG